MTKKTALQKMFFLHDQEWYIRSRLDGDIISPSARGWAEHNPKLSSPYKPGNPGGQNHR